MATAPPLWCAPKTLAFYAVIFVASFSILALVDAHMVIPQAEGTLRAERCPYQGPTKWFGCVLANHESVAGGIVGAAGALLAAWFAWHAITAQISSIKPPSWLRSSSDRTIARNADRAYVTGGPGARMIDENNNHIGIISTGMNTGTTPAFPKEVYWGICKKDDWPDVGKDWPLVEAAKYAVWEEVLPPQMDPADRYPIECTAFIPSSAPPSRFPTMAATTCVTAPSFIPLCSETT